MKKNILRIFSLILIVLLVCTMLSGFVEDWMTPRVFLVTAKSSEDGFNTVLPMEAIHETEEGTIAFLTEEKEGLEEGRYVVQRSVTIVGVEKGLMLTEEYEGERYVQYTSKPLLDGQKVEPLIKREETEDTYLLILPEEAEVTEEMLLACGYTDVILNGNMAQVKDPAAFAPYFEEEVQGVLLKNGMTAERVISLNDVEQFKAGIPLLIGAAALILLLLVLWGIFCKVLAGSSRAKITVVLALIAAGFVGLYFVLLSIDLPSSLLPERTIFDVSFYRSEFQMIRDALQIFSAK